MNHTHTLNTIAAFAVVLLGSASAPAQCDPQEVAKLLADDGAALDRFGWSVAISGEITIVGAYLHDDACPGDPSCNSGSAYLFDTTTGRQIAKRLLPLVYDELGRLAPEPMTTWGVNVFLVCYLGASSPVNSG